MKRVTIVLFVAVLLAASGVSNAQVATGTPPFATLQGGPDVINVADLNAHLTIPTRNKPGRGGMNFSHDLTYDTSVWSPVSVSGVLTWQLVSSLSLPGWSGLSGAGQSYIGYSVTYSSGECTPNGENYYGYQSWTYNSFYYVDPMGTKHTLPLGWEYLQGNGYCGPTTGYEPSSAAQSKIVSDGSGYVANVTPVCCGDAASPFVVNNTGTAIHPPIIVNPTWGTEVSTDSNGNEITSASNGTYTDTSGLTALTVTGTAPSNTVLTYTNTSGTAESFVVKYMNPVPTVQTNFGCTVADGGVAVSEYGPMSQNLVSEIDLPDGSKYLFAYEATTGHSGSTTGRLAQVTLPTGNVINYSYTGGSNTNGSTNGIECADGGAATLTRTIDSDSGSSASTTSYTRSDPNGAGTSHTEFVDGASNYSEYDFVEPTVTSATVNFFESNRSIYQGAKTGTPVLARQTCYNGNTTSCTTTAVQLPISQVDTNEIINGLETHGSTAKYDSYGNMTESDIYDFASGASRGGLQRREDWTYGYVYGWFSLAEGVTEDAVYNSSGVTLAGETTYVYDGTTPTSSSGVPQHVATTWARGNLTSMTVYASSGTSYTTTGTYEDTGSILTAIGATGTTTYSYDSTFSYLNGTELPTPSSGVTISGSATYDTTYTGVMLTSTDPNSETTNYAYADPFLRPTKATGPLVSLGNSVATLTYTISPTQVEQETTQTSTVSTNTQIQYDGYGRPSRVEVANGQSGSPWYQTDTCYDDNGNVAFTSYPYQGSGFSGSKGCSVSGNTVPGVELTYDVLGRILSRTSVNASGATVEGSSYTYSGRATKSVDENGVTRITQIDGLGRTTIVCEVATLGTMLGTQPAASCGTDISANGYTTTYSYALVTPTTTVTQGGQTRTFVSDWLGRPTSVTEPESGTTTYAYSYNSTGLNVVRTRPRANQTGSTTTTTTTQHDVLGRVLTIGYNDGVTPTKTFAYDAATGTDFTELSQTYLKGRLAVASVPTAGTAYSYDAMGRTTALDECLPSGPCGTTSNNRQLQYAYDLASDLITSTDGSMPLSSATTTTYTVSPAEEVLSMTSSLSNSTNPANLVSGVVNNPNGPTSYTLGNGLTNTYSYDTLGRLNSGTLTHSSTTVYSFTNTWKGAQLQGSTDSVLSQTTTYGYDGFNRLASRTVTAGTGPNYAWVYDRWGNRWQQNESGIGSGPDPQLTYNTANNRISTSGYTYDAAGNMTSDGINTYTYDAEGNITAVSGNASATYVYNALNQRVRTTVNSGTPTEFVFNANGQRVSEWNGSTRAQLKGKYYWGGTPVAYYTTAASSAGAAAHFEHQDWLGTERMRTSYNSGNNPTYAVEGTFTSGPWGDAQTVASGTDLDANHYATLDYDAETATDHAQFRQYGDTPGNWMSPDPYSGSYDFSNPQSMNRYVYALDNPLSYIDSLGLVSQPCPTIGCPPSTPDPGTDCDGFSSNAAPCVNFGCDYEAGDSASPCGPPPTQSCDAGPAAIGSSCGYGSAPSNAFGVTPQQKKDCLNAWSNSGLGKGVQFFSLYNLVTNFKNAWKEWTILPALKILSVNGLKATSNALEGGEVVSVTGGTVEALSGPAASGLGSAVSAGAEAAPYGIAAATILDMNASAGCMGMQSNYFSSGQVGVF